MDIYSQGSQEQTRLLRDTMKDYLDAKLKGKPTYKEQDSRKQQQQQSPQVNSYPSPE